MTATTDWRFRVTGLTKLYDDGRVRANDQITLEVRPGEVYGLLGPNGAGKSTLVRQVIGLLKPTDGGITLGRYDLVADPDAARQLCSYLPQAQMPIESFRVREAIELTGRIRGGDAASVRRRSDELIDALDISEWRDRLGQSLSGGVKRLTGFAMVTVWPGRLVILDEPTNDVDPLRRRMLWDQIRALGEAGCAVLLVTHNVMEAEKSVDRLAVIADGRLIAEGTPSSLKADDRDHLRLQIMLAPRAAAPHVPVWLSHVTIVGHNLIGTVDQADGPLGIAWARDLVANSVAEEYALGATTLEDVYIRLTGHVSANGNEA